MLAENVNESACRKWKPQFNNFIQFPIHTFKSPSEIVFSICVKQKSDDNKYREWDNESILMSWQFDIQKAKGNYGVGKI
jgi:hypothetical protein